MKKMFIILLSTTLIFVLIGLIGAFFKEDIFALISFSRTNISAFTISPDLQLMLCLSLIGLVVFARRRSNRK
jgi:hypothetical protein